MPDPDDLTCRELVELVTDYLEGALSGRDRARFEAHLLDCDGCPLYLEQMRLTIRAVGALTEHGMPQAAKDDLLRRFGDWKRGRTGPPGSGR
jgi:anti-sigma factor RsiW